MSRNQTLEEYLQSDQEDAEKEFNNAKRNSKRRAIAGAINSRLKYLLKILPDFKRDVTLREVHEICKKRSRLCHEWVEDGDWLLPRCPLLTVYEDGHEYCELNNSPNTWHIDTIGERIEEIRK